MKKFKEEEARIEDKPRTATTDTNRQPVDELIRAERRVTLRELATQLDCDHNALKKWVLQCTPEFLQREFKIWAQRWCKCIACDGDYV
jgi:hypothetical protein